MRSFGKGILAAVVLVPAMAAANACLTQATNAELLGELSRRLYGGGGGGVGGARATFSCDAYGDFQLGLLGPTGQEQKATVSVRNVQTCGRQRDLLTQYKSRIGSVALVGVCDAYGDMLRFSLTPDGNIQRLSDITIRNVESCLKQADALNVQ